MKYRFSEKDMVLDFCRKLENECKIFSVEVPFLNRSIDLVYQDQHKRIYAMEFKLLDWKKALKQIRDYKLGAKNVFLCIPEDIYNERIERELRQMGCGIYLYNYLQRNFTMKFPSCEETVWEATEAMLRFGFEYSIKNNNYNLLQAL